LSADTIRRLEHGAFSPSLDSIRKVAMGFNLSVAQLFAGFEVDGHDEETGDLVALVRGRGPRAIADVVDLVRVFLRALDEAHRSSRTPTDTQHASGEPGRIASM
jgi:transcriptional regulator with XRE-family HTH domain